MHRRVHWWPSSAPGCFRLSIWAAGPVAHKAAAIRAPTTRPAWALPGSLMCGVACESQPAAPQLRLPPAPLIWPQRGLRRRASWPSTTCRCASKTRKPPCSPAPWQGTCAHWRSRKTATPQALPPKPMCCKRKPSWPTPGPMKQVCNAPAPSWSTPLQCLQGRHRAISRCQSKRSGSLACLMCPLACRPHCCSAGPTSPLPSAAWPAPTHKSAWPKLRITPVWV